MAEPDPNATPPTTGEGGGAPPPNDPAKLEAKNRELLADRKKDAARLKDLETQVAGFNELKGKFEKLTEIAKALGAPDPNAADPEKVKAQLEAEARAKREKADKVNDALTMALLGAGRRLTPDAVRLIRRGAEDHPAISFDDSGNVAGVEPYLESVFQLFGGDAGDRKTPSPPPPGKPGGSAPGVDPKFANVKTFQQLVEMGETARAELERTNPALYATLRAVNLHSARTPAHTVAQAPAR